MAPSPYNIRGTLLTKFLTAILALCLMTLFVTEVSAQETLVNTICNEKSGLEWQMNTELDMKHYDVYVSNAPGIARADPPVFPLIQVPHDPSKKVVTYSLDVTMSEGDKYFTVTASDMSGNMSTDSNEIGCEYNITPGAPTIKL